jgi:pimeloyl-ACP methyl ester carboxylesterase
MSESPTIPTVVLVHGGFADASFWGPVIKDLQAHDLPVLAPPNPLRGLAHDAEYIASYVNQIEGPVLLVGHSYGGAVISVAGVSTPNAVGLVYVAAFALDEGESLGGLLAQGPPTPALAHQFVDDEGLVWLSEDGVRRRDDGSRLEIAALEVPSGHLAMISHPADVVKLITTAAEAGLTVDAVN